MTHVVVTGAAGSIGSAIARAIARRHVGAQLSLVDVDAARTHDLAETIGAGACSVAWDLADAEALDAHVRALTVERGPIDTLVNCAGIMEVRSLAVTPWALAERLLTIDLLSPLRLMSIVTPAMIAARRGTIVNIASMAGLTPLRGCAYYGAAKAGLAMASEIARLELAPHGIKVVTVYPGPVHSELERRARVQATDTLLGRAMPTGDADALARRIVDACDRDCARVVYPSLYRVAERLPGLAAFLSRKLSPAPLDR